MGKSIIDLTLSEDSENDEVLVDENITTVNIAGNVLNDRHFKILQSPSSWFTDDLINAFFSKLTRNHVNSFAVSSFFYESLLGRGKEYCRRHWISKELRTFCDSSDSNLVLFPVNSGGSHWVLVVWHLSTKDDDDVGSLEYYDSMMCRRSGNRIMKNISEFINEIIKEEAETYAENTESADNDTDNDAENDIRSAEDARHVTQNKPSETDDLDDAFLKLSISKAGSTKSSFQVKPIKKLLIPKGQAQQTDGSSCGPFCCWNGKILVENNCTDKIVDIYKFRASLRGFFLEDDE